MSRIGFAIPFHRDVAYLREAIESVMRQSEPDWKLWVVDDAGGHPDRAAAAALVRSLDDPRIHHLENDSGGGMVGNWNRCLDLADSELVTLLHGDDQLLPGYAACMLGLADDHPGAVAFHCEARIVSATGRPVFSLPDAAKQLFTPKGTDAGVLSGEPGATALMRGNFIMCPTLCFRRARLGSRRFDDTWSQVQDLELTVRLLMEGEQIVGTPEQAYAYRRHEGSATTAHSESRLRFEEEFRLFDEIARRAEARGWNETAKVARRRRIVKLHLLYRALREAATGQPGRAGDTLRYLLSRW